MTAETISRNWDGAYGGPATELGNNPIGWARRPRIRVNGKGEWVWECSPKFLREAALNDLEQLRANGWTVQIHPDNDECLLVRIKEGQP